MRFRWVIRRRVRRRASNGAAYRARKEEARALVHARLAHFGTLHPFRYGDVRIKNQRTSWGSCSSKKNLNFNWRLVTLPPELCDYVILHELAHTVHLNHSADFWAFLERLAPGCHAHRAELRKRLIV